MEIPPFPGDGTSFIIATEDNAAALPTEIIVQGACVGGGELYNCVFNCV